MHKLFLIVVMAIVLSLRFVPVGAAQTGKRTGNQPDGWPPAWMASKWTYDDSELRAIREKLEQMKWRTDSPSLKTIASWVETHCKLVDGLIKKGQTKNIQVKEAYWVLALWAYFPTECHKYSETVAYLIMDAPAPASYEYVRVAACATLRRDKYDGLGAVFDKLLTKWSKDPLVRWTYVEFGRSTNGYVPKIHDRMVRYADELYKEFPDRSELLCVTGMAAYADYWVRTKSQSSFDRLMFYFDEAKRDGQIPAGSRKRYGDLKLEYINQGKKAGMKVPGG